MALQNRFMNGMNPQALGVGQMAGQRIAPMTNGPGMPLNINSPMGMAPSMGAAPPLPQGQGAPGGLDINNITGLIGLLGKGMGGEETASSDPIPLKSFAEDINPRVSAYLSMYGSGG